MRLVSIPSDKFYEYRINAIFDCYKWDPQFLDNGTLAKYILVITEEEYKEVLNLTEQLDLETRNAEVFLNNNLNLIKPLALSKKLSRELKKMSNYDESKNVRLMRYDFHLTTSGKWAVSEVNSDVPGGFAEASLLPKLALDITGSEDYYSIDFGEKLANAISSKIKPKGRIMFVHCTSYSDDRQVMQYIGDKMESLGYEVMYGASDHIKFVNKEAISILSGNGGKIDFIFRFTPLEWLCDMKFKEWNGYFDTITPSCNHPVAIYAQTKRFPLVWDVLEKHGIKLDTWRKLLPDTTEVVSKKNSRDYIYKPACGRVGEKISIKEACDDEEYEKIIKDVKKHPKKYLAQKKFVSMPLKGEDGEEFHVCLGSYTIDGRHAGFYARISTKLRIDSEAADIPVIIERSKKCE